MNVRYRQGNLLVHRAHFRVTTHSHGWTGCGSFFWMPDGYRGEKLDERLSVADPTAKPATCLTCLGHQEGTE